jgi:hypothetical protein
MVYAGKSLPNSSEKARDSNCGIMSYSTGQNCLTFITGCEKKQSKFNLTTPQAPLFLLFPLPYCNFEALNLLGCAAVSLVEKGVGYCAPTYHSLTSQ